MWFAQVETQFALGGVTNDATKFIYIFGVLDMSISTEVRDIMTSPPATGKYAKLKTELIRRLGISQDQKTRELLENQHMQDRTPSQFLRHLQSLAGNVFSGDALRTIWTSRLPTNMQMILATQADSTLEKVAELADTIASASPRNYVSETAAQNTATNYVQPMEAMAQQISMLTARIAELTTRLDAATLQPRQN